MKSFYLSVVVGFMTIFGASAYDFSDYYHFVIETNGNGKKMIVGAESNHFDTQVEMPSPEDCTSITIPSDIMEIAGGALRTFGCTDLKIEDSSEHLTVGPGGLNTWALDKLHMGRNTDCQFGFKSGGKLEMSRNVTEIADGQFKNAEQLSWDNITWSTSVTKIGSQAFEGCYLFTHVSVPETVIELGSNCFKDCYNIVEINLPNNLKTIGSNCFKDCYNVVEINLPNNLKTIRSECFSGCSSLKSITIPASVERLEECAFRGCDALKKVVIEDSDTPMTWEDAIYDNWTFSPISPFYLCPLEEAYIGRNITSEYYYPSWGEIVYDAANLFHYIDTIKKITIGNKVTTIRPGMFRGQTLLETVIIGNSVKEIKGDAFITCSSLRDVIFPEGLSSLERIDSYAFYDCESLPDIVIPEGVTSIGEYAFQGCKAAKSIVIPTTVKTIPESCFEHCESIVSLTIPANVDSICNYAFADCLSLKDIHIADSENPLTILNWENEYHFRSAFDNCPVENIYEGRNIVTNTNDFTFDYEPAISTIKSVWLGDFVTELTDGFYCVNLRDLRLSPNLKLIGESCFGGCRSLDTINLPDGLEIIDDFAFSDCYNLREIVFPKSLKKIGDFAYLNCYEIKDLRVPENVKKIGDYAFLNVPLKRLVLEDGVEHIGVRAFIGGNEDRPEEDQYIHTIIVNSPVPPICDDSEIYGAKNAFDWESYEKSELVVPSGSEDLYANADVWKNFRHITSDVKAIDQNNIIYELRDGIIHVEGLADSQTLKIYNIDGKLIYAGSNSEISLPHKGIFILIVGSSNKKIVY